MTDIILLYKKKSRMIIIFLATMLFLLIGITLFTLIQTKIKLDNVKKIIQSGNKTFSEYIIFKDSNIVIRGNTLIDMHVGASRDKVTLKKSHTNEYLISNSTLEDVSGKATSGEKHYNFNSKSVNIDGYLIHLFDGFSIIQVKPDPSTMTGSEVFFNSYSNEMYANQKTKVVSQGYTIYPNRFHYKGEIINITNGFTATGPDYDASGQNAVITLGPDNSVKYAVIKGNAYVFDRTKDTTMRGDEIIFDESSAMIQIYGHADLVSPKYHTSGDYLEYNRHSGVGSLEKNADEQIEIDINDDK